MGTGSVQLPSIEYSGILPELLLMGGAMLLMLISSMFREKAGQAVYSVYTVLIAGASLVTAAFLWNDIGDSGAHSAFSGSIANDRFHLFFVVAISSALILTTLVSGDWLKRHNIKGPELHVLAMLAASGAMIMAGANDLIVIFLGLEILSLALYVMAGFNKRSDRSREAALKYFILGGFSSAVFLYGIALVYGATGSTNLSQIADFLSKNYVIEEGILFAGVALLTVGFGFKVAAAPFHQWTPDVYQGSPSPVTGFMAGVAKAGAFAAFLRVFMGTLFTLNLDWKPVILVLAVVTLLVGSVVACVQKDVKRMLAYSSISHAGFILLGLEAGNNDGVSGVLFYLLAYVFIVVGSFAVVNAMGGDDDEHHGIEAYRGLGRSHPTLALAFTVLLLAQAGLPLTSGFLAKFYVFSALVENQEYALALFAMLVVPLAAFFYLRVVLVMWFTPREAVDSEEAQSVSIHLPAGSALAIALSVLFTIGFGLLPPDVIDPVTFAREAAAVLFQGVDAAAAAASAAGSGQG